MSSKNGRNGARDEQLVIFEADMDSALRRYYRRTGAELATTDMPFDEMLNLEDDHLDGDPGDYEWRQRAIGARSIFTYITSQGHHPMKLLKMLLAAGRGLDVAPFNEFTMEESAMLCGEVKATHSARMVLLSKLMEANGMKGVRLPGQKSPLARESYAASAKRTCNRRKKPKSRSRKPKTPTA